MVLQRVLVIISALVNSFSLDFTFQTVGFRLNAPAGPATLFAENTNLYLGITVGTGSEMSPRVQLGSVPFAAHALTVADGSITTAKLADGAVTTAKIINSMEWVDLPLEAGFHSPPGNGEPWQPAQYRRIGDIVYLRGIITRDEREIIRTDTTIATLPENFRPAKNLAFVSEPHASLNEKHRLDIYPDGRLYIRQSAGETPHLSLDGIFFALD